MRARIASGLKDAYDGNIIAVPVSNRCQRVRARPRCAADRFFESADRSDGVVLETADQEAWAASARGEAAARDVRTAGSAAVGARSCRTPRRWPGRTRRG